ncbi:phosphoglucosamine mutase [Rickettsiales endosymbiont of Trichoplax sp. H2]|uniref:phosphoglucosamine mutase n=1 Tax=Rickettsiales endosymbiont of Trichoplax sp. H2 TaxID=2021221 RepID=UPI0012B421F9|nr:phosphoglucosamine mutase [Rickettsiales endosymbiont of Trichoplax sp. H2]MSO13848.1 Phosphoglucosamine mutase [Rickettsiales endosymbiont of Trichoplax sp. H2]
MKSIFGTDGIRGTVNSFPVTADMALKIGTAIGISIDAKNVSRRVVIAKDTRLSGYMIEPAITSGLISTGADVILVGPMPTPSVPILIKSLRADFGIMITASHNPYHDNGFKLFNKDGYKLDLLSREKIEKIVFSEKLVDGLAEPSKLGRAKRLDDAPGRYIEFVKKAFPKNSTLSGIKIVLDCANGSAYNLAPTILWELGAEVIKLSCDPNGFNINDNCGSMHPENLCKKVVETKSDIGIALDGDSDRIVICDENGNIIPGEYIIAMIAQYLKISNKLKGDAVVVTKVTNLALEEYLQSIKVKTIYSEVGDIKVHELMVKNGLNFGGEESGHIIFSDYSNTGDGIISALQILAIMIKNGKKLSDIANIFKLNPQIKSNIKFKNQNPLNKEEVNKSINNIIKYNANLKIVVRKSGTEKLIRILVEGKDKSKINKVHDEIIKSII